MKEEEKRAYELIFNAIAAGSRIEVTDNHVYVHPSEGSALSAETMDKLLTTPQDFKKVVSKYVVSSKNSAASAGLQNGDLTHALTSRSKMPDSHKFLRALFDDEILKEVALLDLDPAKLREVKGNLIYPITNYKKTKKLWDARIDMLRMVIHDAGAAGIEAVFSSGTPLHLSDGEALDSDLAKNVEDIIGIKFDEHANDAIFYLNKDLINNMVFAPEVVEDEDTGSKRIRIDKDQLAKYLARVLGNMVIPKQEPLHGHNDNCSLVTPVIIPMVMPNLLNKKNMYIFAIDVSSSLSNVATTYKKQLTGIIENIVRAIQASSCGYVNSQDLIRLAFFSNTCRQSEFLVTEAIDDIEKLKQAIINEPIEGGTFLNGTIAKQIDSLNKLSDPASYNVNMYIITDGQDNESKSQDKLALTNHGIRFRAQETVTLIPKFTIIRVVANADDEVSKLKEISQGLDAKMIDIVNINELAGLFEEIENINLRRDLIQFVQGAVITALPVYDGILTTGPKLDLHEKVKINGQIYAIEPAPDHIPDGTKLLTGALDDIDLQSSAAQASKPLDWLAQVQGATKRTLQQLAHHDVTIKQSNSNRLQGFKRHNSA